MPKQVIRGFRLSPQQKKLWSLQQDESRLVYRAQCAIQIEGNLNIKILETAVEGLINKHEILRTTFHCLPGMDIPLQVINETSLLPINRYDLKGLEKSDQAVKVTGLFEGLGQLPFDVEHGPLLHINLVELSAFQSILLVSLPALCADATGIKNLVREISQSYMAHLRGEISSDEPIQYADISEVFNELIESEDTEEGREYWSQLNISVPSDLKFLFAKRHRDNFQFEPQVLSQDIPQDLAVKVDALTHQYQTSTFVIFLTCWQILLWRLLEKSEIVVGTAFDGRNHEDLEEAIGLLTRDLPVQLQLKDEDRFSDTLAKTEQRIQEIVEWQEYFTWKQINPPNGKNKKISFFPFCFEFESWSSPYWVGDISFSIHKQYTCTERFHVKLSCVQKGDSLATEFHYDANLFEVEDIQRLADQFETLLASAVKNPSGAIASFDILSSLEREQLLVEFNDTKTADPPYSCIHYGFEAQCDRTPDNIAVVYENQQLTYRELNERANQLAHHLQQMGVGPEVIVGICVERSLDMLVGVLGILKAGGAYLPLDPAYPKERLAFILEDTQAPVLLTQQRLLAILPEGGADFSWSSTGILEDVDKGEEKSGGAYFRSILCLDSDWKQIARQSSENPISTVTSENLAYLIYTSGSTGKPKGTLIPHRGLVNYLTWCTQAYAVEEGEGTTVHSSLAFDLTITGLFSPLLVGRRVELLPEDFSIESLTSALRQSFNLSLVKITPAQLLLLSQQLSPSEAAGRTRAFIIGGENLLAEHIAFWQNYAPETVLVNEYGPTETVVGCCIYQVVPGELPSGSVPIGRPIANTQLYVLNSYLQPVPMGVVGELYIGGAGVARGYLHRPELTAEKFIPDPFSHEPGARLYKTGDLARFRSDGNLEFLGRIDHQVKVRGFRIELGEIEAVLVQHPGVREAVVMAREDVPGDQRLVAYMVPVTDATPTTRDLQRFLKARLPEYMVPSAFVMLDAFPLTTNGKVDRRSLPTPNQVQLKREGAFVTPHTPVEEMLASIWSRILGIEQVGIYDNFFELGGHSLLVTQVISQIRKVFRVDLPPRCLFEAPTIASLLEQVERRMGAESKSNIPPLKPVSRETHLPLSFAQQRLWFLDRLETGTLAYNGSTVVHLQGVLNVAVLEQCINEIVRRHEVLRTSFPVADGQPIQATAPTLKLSLPVVDLRGLQCQQREEKVQQLVTQEAQRPFNLAEGLLLRVTLLQLGDEEHVFILTIHHIVSDAWSAGVFIREVAALYEAFSQGRPSPLPELPIQYADFAVWQRQWLQGEVLENQLAYWRQQLGSNPPVLALPTERSHSSSQGTKHHFTLSQTLTEALKTLSQQEGVTLFMTLLAAFKTLIHHYSGQDDIIVGSPIANRNQSEIEGLIGFFVNTLVLRTDLSGNPSFREVLGRIREVALGAYTHQDLPFEKLVGELQPERSLGHSPLFQVWFVLQNTPLPPLELPGLTLNLSEVDSGEVRHDLKLDLTETSEGLKGFFEYKTDCFEASAIAHMIELFETVLNTAVQQPDIQLKALGEVLAEVQKQQQLSKEQEFKAARRQKLDRAGRKTIRGQGSFVLPE
ncbi:MAG: amino acid adenylation domain-containing protein [Coleofasciculus sp. S288]|nr:amino acid adenylation domain-containing protein [Coleofasciculus sp. S288]